MQSLHQWKQLFCTWILNLVRLENLHLKMDVLQILHLYPEFLHFMLLDSMTDKNKHKEENFHEICQNLISQALWLSVQILSDVSDTTEDKVHQP